MEKDLLQQLKSLNKIQPSTEWRSSAREDILAQIMGEDSPQKVSLWAEFLYFIRFSSGMFNDFVMKPAGTMALVFLLVLGGGVLKVGADSALPGDLLYSLKKGGEKVQVALIFDDEKRMATRLKIMDERVREINTAVSKMEKNQDIKVRKALASFHKDFTSIRENLASTEEAENSVRIAKNIEDKTSEMQFILTRAQGKSEEDLKGDLDKAIKDVSDTNLVALGVLVDNDGDDSGQFAQKIDSKIDEAMEGASDDVLAKLEEAKEELENKNFVVALQKIKESNELLNDKEGIEIESDFEEATTTLEIDNLGEVKGDATSTIWLIEESATSSCDEPTCSSTPEIK